jgi:2'-5' RNA ligase
MRLFIAVHPAPDLLRRLENAQQILAFASGRGRFPQPGDLHVTLAFLGEQPDDRVTDLLEAMEQAAESLAGTGPPKLAAADAGAMPGAKGDLWIAELGLDPALAELARSLGRELRQRGFPVEKRRFRPHVTLGRGIGPLPDPAGTCEAMRDALRGPVSPVPGYSLVRSVLRPSGPLYEELAYIVFPKGRE